LFDPSPLLVEQEVIKFLEYGFSVGVPAEALQVSEYDKLVLLSAIPLKHVALNLLAFTYRDWLGLQSFNYAAVQALI